MEVNNSTLKIKHLENGVISLKDAKIVFVNKGTIKGTINTGIVNGNSTGVDIKIDELIKSKDRIIKEKDRLIKTKDDIILEKEIIIKEKEMTIQYQATLIKELTKSKQLKLLLIVRIKNDIKLILSLISFVKKRLPRSFLLAAF